MVKRMKFKFTSLDDNSKADLLAASRDWRSIYLGVLALLFNGTFITFFLFTPLIIESLLELVGIPEGDTYIYSVALTTIPALFTVIFLGLTGTFLRAAPSTWRWPFGAIDLCLTVLLYAALPASYNSGNFLLGLFTYSFLAGLSSPVMAVVDVFPSLYLQKNGASSSYFSVLNSIKQLSSIWTPAVIGSLIPVLGAAQAVTVVGLAYTIPGALMFTGWFYLIGKDEPIAGHKRSSAKDSADAL